MKSKLKAAWAAARTSAKRELGLFAFMMIFAFVVALVAVPIILLLSLLPDWTCWLLVAAWLVWVVLGDTIAASVRAFRGERP